MGFELFDLPHYLVPQLDQDTSNSLGDSVSGMDIKGWSRAPDMWVGLSLEVGNDFDRNNFGEHRMLS